jgi:hypothetical protein
MNTFATTMKTSVPYQPTGGFGNDADFLVKRIKGAGSILRYFSIQPEEVTISLPAARRRFTLDELLRGATEESVSELYRATSFNQEGGPVGRELA